MDACRFGDWRDGLACVEAASGRPPLPNPPPRWGEGTDPPEPVAGTRAPLSRWGEGPHPPELVAGTVQPEHGLQIGPSGCLSGSRALGLLPWALRGPGQFVLHPRWKVAEEGCGAGWEVCTAREWKGAPRPSCQHGGLSLYHTRMEGSPPERWSEDRDVCIARVWRGGELNGVRVARRCGTVSFVPVCVAGLAFDR